MNASGTLRSFFFVAALGATLSAHATYLVDPTGGTVLSGFNDNDTTSDPGDGQLSVPLGGAFNFYGTSYSSLYVNVNGFITPSNDGYGYYSDRSVGALAGLTAPGAIAAFYDDVYLDTTLNDSITRKATSAYTTITYAISGDSDVTTGHQSNFQTTLVSAPTTLQGNALLAGDIVFSYGALASTIAGSNFSVGVAASAANATNAFGATGGQFATATSFLGNFNSSTQALLFRYNAASSSYTRSLITYQPVPEPATFAALGLGALAFLKRRKQA